MARRLEAAGDTSGALAALTRAAAADKALGGDQGRDRRLPAAAEPSRRSREGGARGAGPRRGQPRGAPCARLVYAGDADAAAEKRQGAQSAAFSRDAITHLERVALSPSADIALHYTLGRLYLRIGAADKAVQALGRVLSQNPELRPGPVDAGAGACGGQQPHGGHRHARGDRRGRAARGLGARAVSGAGGPVEGSGRELHARADRHADEPRAQVPARCGALYRRRVRALRRVCGRGAGRASRGPALPAAAGARALRQRRIRTRVCAPRDDGEGVSAGRRDAVRAGGLVQRRRIATTTPSGRFDRCSSWSRAMPTR